MMETIRRGFRHLCKNAYGKVNEEMSRCGSLFDVGLLRAFMPQNGLEEARFCMLSSRFLGRRAF